MSGWEKAGVAIALLMLLDSIVLLAGLPFWQRRVPAVRLHRLALLEAVAALLILALYFTFR